MNFRLLAGMSALCLSLIPSKPADQPLRDEIESSVLDLSFEVQALRTLYLMRVTTEQAKAMERIARDVATPDREREKPHASEGYRRTLARLRDALAEDDDDKVDDREDRLSELTDTEGPELDDAVRITAAARQHVPRALHLFRPTQVAGYLGSIAEEVGDPQERLVAALEEVRPGKEADWEDTRDDLAEELGWLLGGLDAGRAKEMRGAVAALLTRAHNLSDTDFAKRRADLEKESRALGADVGPTDVLRHAVERALARLLSNPRLAEALRARINHADRARPGGSP